MIIKSTYKEVYEAICEEHFEKLGLDVYSTEISTIDYGKYMTREYELKIGENRYEVNIDIWGNYYSGYECDNTDEVTLSPIREDHDEVFLDYIKECELSSDGEEIATDLFEMLDRSEKEKYLNRFDLLD